MLINPFLLMKNNYTVEEVLSLFKHYPEPIWEDKVADLVVEDVRGPVNKKTGFERDENPIPLPNISNPIFFNAGPVRSELPSFNNIQPCIAQPSNFSLNFPKPEMPPNIIGLSPFSISNSSPITPMSSSSLFSPMNSTFSLFSSSQTRLPSQPSVEYTTKQDKKLEFNPNDSFTESIKPKTEQQPPTFNPTSIVPEIIPVSEPKKNVVVPTPDVVSSPKKGTVIEKIEPSKPQKKSPKRVSSNTTNNIKPIKSEVTTWTKKEPVRTNFHDIYIDEKNKDCMSKSMPISIPPTIQNESKTDRTKNSHRARVQSGGISEPKPKDSPVFTPVIGEATMSLNLQSEKTSKVIYGTL